MKIVANGHEIDVESVVSTSISRHGKSYPALKFVFEGAITAEDIEAIASGDLQIGEFEHPGYTTRGEISMVVGKITTAEDELAEANEVLGIISGNTNISKESAREQRNIIEDVVQALSDEKALIMVSYYPTWEECVEKGTIEFDKPGFKFSHNGLLYSCINPNPTFLSGWVPGEGTESLYTRIDEAHAGTEDDPIPYSGNMILFDGLYYEQDGVVYICFRDSGIAIHNALADLVGHYVQVA